MCCGVGGAGVVVVGGSVEVMALALLHPAPEAWAPRDALKATLVISPPALLGQRRAELVSLRTDATVAERDAAEGGQAQALRSGDLGPRASGAAPPSPLRCDASPCFAPRVR